MARAFDADAVAWNFEKQLKTQPLAIGSGLVPPYSEFRDRRRATRLRSRSKSRTGYFMNILAAPLLMMVDPSRYEEPRRGLQHQPEWDRPLQVRELDAGPEVVLEANTEYWDPDNGPGVAELVPSRSSPKRQPGSSLCVTVKST